MVSQTLPRDREQPPQLRRMDPARDLNGIAEVIETSFASELSPGGHVIMRELRMLNSLGPILWLFSRAFPSLTDLFGGYVWEEAGRVVGNATLTHGEGNSQWIISNVAVLPDYRRRGIARAMMEAAVQHARQRGGARVMLQVHHENEGAKLLYERMGFRYMETLTEMICDQVRHSRLPQPDAITVRPPDPERWYEAFDVARAAIPRTVQEMRPLRPQSFRIRERAPLERLRDAIFGPERERWWAEQEGRVTGLLTIERQMSRQSELVEMLIHPASVGQVEAALINRLTTQLAGHRGTRIAIASHLTAARALLRDAGFHELRTLDQMVLEL